VLLALEEADSPHRTAEAKKGDENSRTNSALLEREVFEKLGN
jgi:hypothetical protein